MPVLALEVGAESVFRDVKTCLPLLLQQQQYAGDATGLGPEDPDRHLRMQAVAPNGGAFD
jgi:hypothetical protein